MKEKNFVQARQVLTDAMRQHPEAAADAQMYRYKLDVLDVLIGQENRKIYLNTNPDTLSYWTTLDQAYPYEFFYGITSGTASGNTQICDAIGWHEAVRLMKYPNSQCQIIVPSKQGFDADQTSVTPYIYIMKIQVKN